MKFGQVTDKCVKKSAWITFLDFESKITLYGAKCQKWPFSNTYNTFLPTTTPGDGIGDSQLVLFETYIKHQQILMM